MVERRVHDAPSGGPFTLLGHGGAEQLISDKSPIDQWIMLRFIEELPEYRALLERLIAELGDAIETQTSPARNIRGFVFVSAPDTHTPLHFDCEFNILFQVAGTKTFATYPPRPPFVSLAEREAYHCSGGNMLGWQADFAAQATQHQLQPGDALFVPYAALHWVKAGAEPSISLSLTWQNQWSEDVADALRLNPLMRCIGLAECDPANAFKPLKWRVLAARITQKAGVL
ncbi:MAG: cupin-like domain-containing protein [Erythrobacter sp.]